MKSSSTRRLEVSDTLNARYSAAIRPITDCQKYFSRDGMPSGFFCTTLRQSSTQPMAPKPSVTISTIHTKRLLQSNHSKVDTPMPMRISTPPIVGVPLFARWACTPYSRIGWPIFSSARRLMTQGPNARPISSAVIAAITARKVMYWKTRRKPKCSGSTLCSHNPRLCSMQCLHHLFHLHEARSLDECRLEGRRLGQRGDERGGAVEMARAGAEGRGGLGALRAGGPQRRDAARLRVFAHFLVEGRALVADLAHVAEHQPLRRGQLAQHVDRRAHRVGVGVVAVVDQREPLVAAQDALE